MTDHYEKALKELQDAYQEGDPWALIRATMAQAEATLALAEQQRIANLIALNEQWEKSEYPNFDAVSPMLCPEIARALRIETP